jgi:hypothetical protein
MRSLLRLQALSRRELFQRVGAGVGSLALAELLARELPADPANPQSDTLRPQSPLATRPPHHAARAKSVIFVHLVGAPSHLDLYEHKPALNKFDGELCPEEYLRGQRFAFLRGHPRLMGSSFKFQQHGQSGVVLSELLPHLATVADELAVIKTVQTEQFNHAPAQLFFHTGFGRFGRPTLGSWLTYGLGTENQDLPAFVVMITGQVAGAGTAFGGAVFCRRFTRESSSVPAATPCCSSPTRKGFPPTTAGGSSTASTGLTRHSLPTWGTRKSPPASASTRWRFACKRPSRVDGHFSRVARDAGGVWRGARARRASPTTASWPGGWWSGECDLCSSWTKVGTTTARSTPLSPRSARRSINRWRP